MNPSDWYQQRIQSLEAAMQQRLSTRRKFIAGRLLAALVIGAALYMLRSFEWTYIWTAAALFLAGFLRLAAADNANDRAIANLECLIRINRDELDILADRYAHRPDGARYLPPRHDYAYDLDIAGRASLFQLLNRAESEQGCARLMAYLLAPADAAALEARQLAVKELAALPEWRQQLQAHGVQTPIAFQTQRILERWLEQAPAFQAPVWRWLRYVLPAIVCSALALTLAGFLSASAFSAVFIVFFVAAGAISKQVVKPYVQLNRIVRQTGILSESLAHIESAAFQAPLLQTLSGRLSYGNAGASQRIRALETILQRLDYRLNTIAFIALNTFLLWDLQQILALEDWKADQKARLPQWFEALAEMEALSSLAALHFNRPHWAFPGFASAHFTLESKDLGHPLIPESKRVSSDFSLCGAPQIAFVTGSNMAGKSTFLRTVGLNLVLAMAGAPVCAASFRCSPVGVMSSMRIADNLEENASTFYAELDKLKHIIGAVSRKEKVFLLLDEILRGTNSGDRHRGSEALMRQLLRDEAVGMIASHDLALAALQETYPQHIANYYFDAAFEGEELYFDYRLKPGVCQAHNAAILMRKIGIDC